jgi:recombinational DNA repair protein (RecF pathway)
MPAEKAQALVLRTTDGSETSRIATVWTREFGSSKETVLKRRYGWAN